MRNLHIISQEQAADELRRIGADPYGIRAMVPKMETLAILLEQIPCKVGNILKQEMLSLGGDAALSRGSVDCSIEKTDAILIGTVKQINKLAEKITIQPFGLNELGKKLSLLLSNIHRDSYTLKTPYRDIAIGAKTLIMGIINMTPDSFSDGGMFKSIEDAFEYGVKLAEAGADILDIGGESSRPGSDPVSSYEETRRVIHLIQELKKQTNVPISIDTTKSNVAAAAIQEGAELVNDISALRFDATMAAIVAQHKVPVILMHMRGIPKTMQLTDLVYRSLVSEIITFLEDSIEKAKRAGIDYEKIIVDPGIGFGKTMKDNNRLIKYLKEFMVLGRPIIVGTSRKTFIGKITGGEPFERLEGTAATVAAAIMNGAHIVRVHDVEFMRKVADMTDAIMRS